MDTNAKDAKMDQDYDDYIAQNEVLSIDELEKRQLSNSSQIATGKSNISIRINKFDESVHSI